MPLFTLYAYLIKFLVIVNFFLVVYIIIFNTGFYISIRKIKKKIGEKNDSV